MIKRPAQFYKLNKFVVQPEKASSKASNVWNILTPGGVKLGYVAHFPDGLWARFLRFIKFKANYGTKIAICDAEDNPIVSIIKPFSFGLFTARLKDIDGPFGTIKEIKQGLDGRRYVIYNQQGEELGCMEGDWNSFSMQIKTPKVASMGKLSRVADELNPVIFDNKNKYYVVDLYINPKDARLRRMLLSCCAALDALLH